ncbi:hypothetical protein [Actibacterium ureilyticum]|uniref:hypothetical protein n=1 Tax=Actibacterium ureilyticum TaxID=1590614 RepID=UPI00159524FC|nr:hypothetical protein [Actibacterium ureilyticum]
MATTITNTNAPQAGGILTAIGAPFRALGRGLVRMAEQNPRLKRIQALQAKSDAELAELGLKRDDIVHHVFRASYYL